MLCSSQLWNEYSLTTDSSGSAGTWLQSRAGLRRGGGRRQTDWRLQPFTTFKVNWSTSGQLITLEIVSSYKPNLSQEAMHSLMHLLPPFHKITPVLSQSSRMEQDKNPWQESGLQLVQKHLKLGDKRPLGVYCYDLFKARCAQFLVSKEQNEAVMTFCL